MHTLSPAPPHFHEMFDNDDIIGISAATEHLLLLSSYVIILHSITHTHTHMVILADD